MRDEAGLPTAFRLFKAGENETTKGTFIFDGRAAEMVLAAAGERGVELAIDLEHLALDQESRGYDPDARGWFQLEVRNGELWAVNVRWTPDGTRRLSEKTQRYISPAFTANDDGRVTEIVSIALVAMPATHGTPALVAASRRPQTMSIKHRLSARLSIAKGEIVKLAEDGAEAKAPGKFAAVQAAAKKCEESCAALEKVSGVDEGMDATAACMSSMEELEKAIAALTGAPSDEPAATPPAPDAAASLADDKKDEEQKMSAAKRDAEIVSLRKELESRKHAEQVERLAREMDERRSLVASLVKLGRETPATAWADETATAPRGSLATMPISELRDRVKLFGGQPVPLNIRPPSGHTIEAGAVGGVSEAEATYVKARHGALTSLGQKLRSMDETMSRLARHKAQQMRGAEEKGDRSLCEQLARPVDAKVLAYAGRAGLITLASTPVQPFEEFGASSQIALQNFRLEYNLALASIMGGWAENVGRVLPDGSMKTTYPLNFRALKYTEKTAQNAATGQPVNVDIAITQREFYEGQEIELRRLIKGDFAYVQSWAQLASDLARARIFLRDELVTALLEAGTTGYWGSSATMATGIDGQPFFSATHKINPFDPTKKLRTVATYSNYQASATPLNAANLTAEKNAATQVAAPDGRELGITFDGILYPSLLEQTAVNLLKVQDLILDAKATLNSVSNAMGQVRNPHYQSGLEMMRAQQLAGTDATANYYLYSKEAISRGLVPWVIAEDPTEEVRLFDENSDFYKTTGHIKYESHVFLNAVLLYPHAIRYVKGA